jgi:hypothetical protein
MIANHHWQTTAENWGARINNIGLHNLADLL